MEVYAHIGGQPLGMAFDRQTTSMSASAAWGFIASRPTARWRRRPTRPTAACASVNDDSRLRLADDLDITDDGRIFFSEATVRYEMHEWPVDGLEARGNGRIICYDPATGTTRTVLRGLKFPNGICVARDGQSILFAETWGCCVKRYWFDGPRSGQVEMVMDNLPGFPDNINLASDGNYWLAMVGHALARRSISPGACPASAGAWPSACRSTNGCFPTSTPAACSSSTTRARCWKPTGTWRASIIP